jgi:MoaA/NifB/PqqE/SkfB family radical SAM enzyme
MRSTFWRNAILVSALVAAHPALAQQADTVNSYTPAQEQKARSAARAAGYQPAIITMVQAGNFFMDATRGGHRYQLTITPDGKVYPSNPLD